MRKAVTKTTDDLRRSYTRGDFGKLVRGKYAARLSGGSNIVVLDPDVAKAFPTERSVNEALRRVIDAGQDVKPGPARRVRRAAAGTK